MLIYGGVFLNNYSYIKSRIIPSSKTPNSEYSFLELHNKCAKYYAKNVDNVIIYLNGSLYLLSCDNLQNESSPDYLIEETPANQTSYNNLKIMAHISVSINIMLLPYILGNSSCYSYIPMFLNNLVLHIEYLKKSQGNHTVFDDTLKYIELFQNCKSKSEMENLLKEYNKIIFHSNGQLCKLSSDLQLKGIDKIISDWKLKGYLCTDNIKIIIAGAQGPRKKHVEKEYFERKYGVSNVTYIEMLPKQLQNVSAYDLLERLLEDEQNKVIGDYMFNNSKALFEDVLADYARETIDELSNCPFHIKRR